MSEVRAREVLEALLPDEELRQSTLATLAESIQHAHRANQSSWGLTLAASGEYLRLNVGRVLAFSLNSGTATFIVLPKAVPTPLRKLVRGAEIGDSKAHSELKWCNLAHHELAAVWPDLRDAHLQAVQLAAQAVRRTPYYYAHSHEALAYLRDSGLTVPSPRYQSGLPPEHLERLLGILRQQFPGWSSFGDPDFVADEIAYKKETIAKAGAALAAPTLRRLLDASEFDEILKRLEAIGRDNNLLYTSMPREGDLGILYAPDLDKAGFCAAVVDLLHGSGETPERLQRYLDWVVEARLPNKWTFPTYFLFVCHPTSEIFVKPTITTAFLHLIEIDEVPRGKPTATAYTLIRDLAHRLKDAFARYGAQDMVDVQSLIWVCGRAVRDVRYWKISPEERAALWEEWREGGYASIGWEKLGDISGLDKEAFEVLRRQIQAEDDDYTSQGAGQVLKFANLREGDRLVANRGQSEVVGIGTVTGPYYFVPGVVHGHRVPVEWTDTRLRAIPRQPWSSTLRLLPRQLFEEIERAPSRSDPPPADRTFSGLLRHLRARGLTFSSEVVSNYLLALQTKRFVILTGISGTGKTQLAREVARYLSGICLVEAVRPDWTDNRGLLGYFNPLTGRYVRTPFLDLMLRAHEEAEIPFFAILDEMNLARVEHYFSDFLSAMESGEAIHLHDEPAVERGETEDAVPIPRSLTIPPNLFFTGTVNVDESTYMFSPKVLDRAFTLELNEVDLSALSQVAEGGETEGTGLRLDGLPNRLEPGRAPGASDWQDFGRLLDGDLRRTVEDLNQLLAVENRHFGYRVAVEIARFVNLAAKQSKGEPSLRSAFDLALLQKVLPKLHGTQQELEEILAALARFAAPETEERPRLPRFAAKIGRMRRRLQRQGFTSFIE